MRSHWPERRKGAMDETPQEHECDWRADWERVVSMYHQEKAKVERHAEQLRAARAEERERCAKIAESMHDEAPCREIEGVSVPDAWSLCQAIAAAIRAAKEGE